MPVKTTGLIDELYAGVLDARAWRQGLRSLAREWHARGAVLASFDAGNGERLRVESEPPDLEALVPAELQPRIALTGATVARLGRGYCIERTSDRVVVLWLPDGRAVPPAGEPAPSHPLVVHLLRALGLRERLETAQLHSALLDASVGQLNLALLLLDGRGVVLARSALAAELLAGDCGLRLEPDGTVCIDSNAEPLVASSRVRSHRAAVPPLRLPRAGRAPLTVLLWPQEGAVRWMAVLCDPEFAPALHPELIAADLGVSLREAEVAAQLCRGLTPADIARRMRISINTVRSHVKSIYGKTGTHSRVELIRRIATSPAALLRPD